MKIGEDSLRDKILAIVQEADGPITLNAIYFKLHSRDVNRNMMLTRLLQLKQMGYVNRVTIPFDDFRDVMAWIKI